MQCISVADGQQVIYQSTNEFLFAQMTISILKGEEWVRKSNQT